MSNTWTIQTHKYPYFETHRRYLNIQLPALFEHINKYLHFKTNKQTNKQKNKHNLKQNEAQSAPTESTHKGVN